ncbi:MAG TPA: PBS lyase [Cyanobacteria bacterium UBA11162]|nr:PBS lyase [Cyanobacteria bacterium UBA11162]
MSNSKIDSLIKQCNSGDSDQEINGVQELLAIKAYSAVPTLIELLKSSDSVVRSVAAAALGYLGKPEPEAVGSALVQLLVDPDDIVRSDAVDALGILGYAAAIEPVKSLLKNDPIPFVRASAAETLGDLGQQEALAALEEALLDPDEAVRGYAANSMGLVGTPELLPKLKTYIESEQSLKVKVELLGATYRLGAREDVELILNLLAKADQDLAIQTLNVLEDLIGRKQPSAMAEDASDISEVLAKVAKRFPILDTQIDRLIVQLKALS